MSEQAPLQTFYDAVGGHATFVALVKRFYEGVASDPQLRALYPEADLASAEERLRMFLEQYWGGPTTYSRATRASTIADAPCSLRRDAGDAGSLAAAHAGRDRLHRAHAAAGARVMGLHGAGGVLDGQHL